MFQVNRVRTTSARLPMRLLGVAAVTLAVALMVAGCGGSNSAQGGSKTASNPTGGNGAAHSTPSVARAELTLRSSHYGPTISDAHHRVLYLFAADHTAKSTCYGDCAKAWPPMLTNGAPKVGSGLNASRLGTTRRRDGSTQVTYAGHPLYYFSEDKGSKIMCQHVKLHGGFWYVVKPNGTANMAKGMGMM